MDVKDGYKLTEVGIVPEDWDVLPLENVGRIIRGASPRPKGDRRFYGGTVPRLMVEDVTRDRKYVTPQVDFLTEAGAKLSRPCDKGTLTIVCSGTVGVASFLAVDACIHDGFLAIVDVRDEYNQDYLYHQFCALRETFDASATHGGVFTNLTTTGIKEFVVAFPEKFEQQAIAEALSDADAFIESLEQLIVKKQLIKQGAMQELLTGKRRLPGFDGEWSKCRFGEIARIQRGASPRPIDDPRWFDRNSSIGWVRISDVSKSGMYLLETTQALSTSGVANSRPIAKGSLIMSICATVGRPVVTAIDACIHDGFVVFDDLSTDKFYTYYALQYIESDWYRYGQTGSQMNLNTDLINRTEIDVPNDKREQSAIAQTLSHIDTEITALEFRLAKARQIKQGMMQELLTGRIRLMKPDTQSA